MDSAESSGSAIVTALTGIGFQEYAITMNIYPKRVDKVIEQEEQHIQRVSLGADL